MNTFRTFFPAAGRPAAPRREQHASSRSGPPPAERLSDDSQKTRPLPRDSLSEQRHLGPSALRARPELVGLAAPPEPQLLEHLAGLLKRQTLEVDRRREVFFDLGRFGAQHPARLDGRDDVGGARLVAVEELLVVLRHVRRRRRELGRDDLLDLGRQRVDDGVNGVLELDEALVHLGVRRVERQGGVEAAQSEHVHVKAGQLRVDALGAELQQVGDVFHGGSQGLGVEQLETRGVLELPGRALLGAAALVGVLLGRALGRLALLLLLLLDGLLGGLFTLRGIGAVDIPVGRGGGGAVVSLEVDGDGVQRGARVKGVLADAVLPAQHVDVGTDEPLAQGKGVEVKLVLDPRVEDGLHELEPSQRAALVARASKRLAVLGDVPHGLHVDEVHEGAADRLGPREETHGLDGLVVLVVPQLVLGGLGADVPVARVEGPRVVHPLGRLFQVALVLPYPRLGHVEFEALGDLLDRQVDVLHGLGQVAAEVVVVVLRQVVQGGGLALGGVAVGGPVGVRPDVVVHEGGERLLLGRVRVEVLEVRLGGRLEVVAGQKVERQAAGRVGARVLGGKVVVDLLPRLGRVESQRLLQLGVVLGVVGVAVDEGPVGVGGVVPLVKPREVLGALLHDGEPVEARLGGGLEVLEGALVLALLGDEPVLVHDDLGVLNVAARRRRLERALVHVDDLFGGGQVAVEVVGHGQRGPVLDQLGLGLQHGDAALDVARVVARLHLQQGEVAQDLGRVGVDGEGLLTCQQM
ncbi:hypothetical protein BN1708_005519 [Verticillium longisporum]|uniref:Uncharacterized protein n=1 Tax=Verticillium longisporum TaxID=100787 RepID=A0A0G4MBN6_VERLO|nr:hypothetical protein BN1708_005519 [Verticillium longisporum]